jgi:hypothetical protein
LSVPQRSPSTQAATGIAGRGAKRPPAGEGEQTTVAELEQQKRTTEPEGMKRFGLLPDAAEAEQQQQQQPQQPAAAGAGEQGLYVYCIIECPTRRSFGEVGIGNRGEAYTINFRDLAAVVSDTPLVVYDPTRENVLCHEHVNELVMEEFTVLPMSFGTVFRTREDIVELLKSTYDALKDVLQKMKGKIEFGLKVNWDKGQVLAEIERDNEDIGKLKEEIEGARTTSTYFARMQLGRLVDAALSEKADGYVEEIYAALREVAIASRSNKPIGENMIMNAAFLIDRERAEEFDRAVNEIAKRFEGKLHFKYTGPWPPYNFVNIRLKLERAREE